MFQTIVWFLFFDFNGFWPENDVTRLTEKLCKVNQQQKKKNTKTLKMPKTSGKLQVL